MGAGYFDYWCIEAYKVINVSEITRLTDFSSTLQIIGPVLIQIVGHINKIWWIVRVVIVM